MGAATGICSSCMCSALRETQPATCHLSSCLAADRMGSRTLKRRRGEKRPLHSGQ